MLSQSKSNGYFQRIQLLLLSTTSYSMEYPFVRLGSADPAVSPPNLLPTPNLLTAGTEWETKKVLMLCKRCSAIAKTRVCYQHWFGHEHSSVQAAEQT